MTDMRPNERLEDLNLDGLMIMQDPNAFRFGIDAVLLSHYALPACKRRSKIMDLCTGTGVIPLLIYGHHHCEHIDGMEIQPAMADLAQRNVRLNGLENFIHIYNSDLRDPGAAFHSSTYDVITCNPPYMPLSRGMQSPSDPLAIARHEITCTITDVAAFARIYLKDKGKLYLVHRADRLIDIAAALREKQIEIKRIRFVYPYAGKPANLVLIEAMKKGQPAAIIEPPLYVYNADGSYTDEINEIYGTEGPQAKDI